MEAFSCNGFSGINILALLGDKHLGILQCVNFTTTIKRPTDNRMTPPPSHSTGFVREKVVVAGNLIFKTLDRSILTLSDWPECKVPSFDIALKAIDEYGAVATMKIVRVGIMNSSYGVNVDEIKCGHKYTFLADELTSWELQ